MYVRRCPRISASSRTPPSDMRTNSRPVARAIDSPIDVLPVPGGPIRVRIAPERRSSWMPRSTRSFLTARYSTMRSLTSSRPAWSASSTDARVDRIELLVGLLRPRHGDEPVEVGADHAGLGRLLAHALEPPELLGRLLVDGLGHAGLGELRAVLVDDRGGVLAQLALDRLHLLAQEVLALLLVGALADVLADLAAQLQLDEPLALDPGGELEALGDVERLEDLDLLLERHVGRVADRVGQRAGLDDGAQELADAVVGAAELEDLLDHGAVLALGGAGAPVDGDVVRGLRHLDAQAPGGVGVGGARDAAGDAGELHGAAAAGQADAVGDLGDRAHLGELAVVAGDEQHALLVTRVDGEGHIHGGEDDGVVEGEEQERGHKEWLSPQ